MLGKRGLRAAWGLALGAALLAGGRAGAEEPQRFLGGFITESRVLYPLKVGDWQAQGEHRYEDPAGGVSVRYRDENQPDRWLDLYFYPAGKLDEARLRQVVETSRREMQALAGRPDGYEAVEVGTPERFELKLGSGRERLAAYRVPIRMVAKGRSYQSELALLVQDMYFVKLRYSVPAEHTSPRRLRAQARDFLQALVQRSRVVSTGGCWNPLPLVVGDNLDAQADDVLMSNSVDGRVTAVAFPDRVEMREEEPVAGRLLQALASLHIGRIADLSCVAPENVDLSVEEGLREIRLEYRVPPDEDGGGRRD